MESNDGGRERRITRDRETIRNWADRHDVVPVREASSAGEDRYRMVPERRMEDTHERVEWNRFFEDFEDGDRVVVYHGEDVDDPFEVSDRGEIATELDDEDLEERLIEGETVTSTVTETAVVESVVTEELTVESELVDTETVDQRIVDSELRSRSATDCRIVDDASSTGPDMLDTDDSDDAGRSDVQDAFDRDRYLAAVGGRTESAPGDAATEFEGEALSYDAEIDVEERWFVTRELTEQYVVESEIVGAEITGADSLEDYDLDVNGLHRTILESGIIEEDLSTEAFLTEHEAESELTEDDRVTSSFTRQRTVRDEIIDRKVVRGDLTGGEVLDMELVSTEDVAPGEREDAVAETDATETGATSTGTVDAGTDDAGATDVGTADTGRSEPGETAPNSTVGTASISDDDVGKTVVDPTGDDIGTVTAVDESANAMYVDANPGLTDRIKSALGWGSADDEDHRLDASHVERVTDDEIRVDHREGMDDPDHDHDRR